MEHLEIPFDPHTLASILDQMADAEAAEDVAADDVVDDLRRPLVPAGPQVRTIPVTIHGRTHLAHVVRIVSAHPAHLDHRNTNTKENPS